MITRRMRDRIRRRHSRGDEILPQVQKWGTERPAPAIPTEPTATLRTEITLRAPREDEKKPRQV